MNKHLNSEELYQAVDLFTKKYDRQIDLTDEENLIFLKKLLKYETS